MDKKQIISDIRTAMRVERLTQSDLAKRTRMSQARVSQILSGDFATDSTRVRTLHAYVVGLLDNPERKIAATYEGVIKEAAIDAWDNTEAGAKALLDLLRHVKLIQKSKA